MKCSKLQAGALATALLTAASIAPALAVTTSGGAQTSYVAAFAPLYGGFATPHSGTMNLTVRNGIINGTYTGTSVMPDNFDGRLVMVTGTVSPDDGYVQLSIGGALTLRGTMSGDGTISGTADEEGRLYEFEAAPKSGPPLGK